MESDSEAKLNFVEWLKTGKAQEPTGGTGGFLVPEFMSYPSKGLKAWLWRFIGRCLFKLGYGSLGLIAHDKGCYQVRTYDLLTRLTQR